MTTQADIAAGEERGRLLRRVTAAALAVALLLALAKAVVWWRSGSVVMLSSALDSLLDAFASFINLLAVRHALMPADREHRFGHGKAEPLAGLAQAAFIGASTVALGFEAVRHLLTPEPIHESDVAIGMSVVALVVTAGLVFFQRRVIRRTGSIAIAADSLHYVGDLMMNVGVIVALVLAGRFGLTWADPVFALAIAAWMIKGVYGIFKQSYDNLMDREMPVSERERIKAIVLQHSEARAIHDLRTRASGSYGFIQFHLELDGQLTLSRAHEIGDEIEAAVLAAFPGSEVIIHQDPAGLEEPVPVYARH
jgi:ferrous-iron efflux pump FieF